MYINAVKYQILALLRSASYKDIFNYLYTIKFRNELTHDEIIKKDYEMQIFYQKIISKNPESLSEEIDIEGEDPTSVIAYRFFELYEEFNKNK